jgi:hypothetical protein
MPRLGLMAYVGNLSIEEVAFCSGILARAGQDALTVVHTSMIADTAW